MHRSLCTAVGHHEQIDDNNEENDMDQDDAQANMKSD